MITWKIGDCLELMKQYPDKHFDLLLTDPPYGIHTTTYREHNRSKLAKTMDYGTYTWDNEQLREEYFTEMIRVSKNQVIFGGNYYANYLPPSSCWIVWDKNNTGGFADAELAWTSFPTAVRVFKWRWNGMLQENMAKKEKRVHPTQKPVALFQWILEKYSSKNDVICDPFLGSGTTLMACRRTNRNCIGFENDPQWKDLYSKRCMSETPQLETYFSGDVCD